MSSVNSDTLRWAGTVLATTLVVAISLIFIGLLSLHSTPIPEVLSGVALAGTGAIFTAFGTMIGARSSQNGQQIAMGQQASGR